MFRRILSITGLLSLMACAGCVGTTPLRHLETTAVAATAKSQETPPATGSSGEKKNADEDRAAKNGQTKSTKPPSVLFEWTLRGHAPEQEKEEDEEDKEPPLASDRPDFVEASVNVGAGRIQLEMGYTLIRDRQDGVTTQRHSYPEALLRIGLWTDWLEFRIGQNLGTENTRAPGLRTSDSGAEDLYLGLGVGLTEQKGIFPESRVNLQARVPTGCDAFNDRHFLPGMNYLYGWEVIEDRLGIGASTAWNRKRDDVGQTYIEIAQAVTTAITLTDKLGMYLETFALFPTGADVALPEYYADGGFTYRVTPNLQFDIRAGVGLNRNADDFFTGAGVVVRY